MSSRPCLSVATLLASAQRSSEGVPGRHERYLTALNRAIPRARSEAELRLLCLLRRLANT